MIIVRISGGLGNQMFQYAFGRSLSLSKKTGLALDLSSFEARQPNGIARRYALDAFDIHVRIATKSDFDAVGIPIPGSRSPAALAIRAIVRTLDNKRPINEKKIMLERTYAYDEGILGAADSAYFSGVWQSEKYFRGVAEIIRGDFALTSWGKLASNFKRQMEKLSSGTPISVHVRRGDYASDPRAAEKHGTLPISYYEKAYSLIRDRVEDPTFYIFSDDPGWCKDNLSFMKPFVIVSDPDLTEAEEMTLMSIATHHIIANSTFSWWGAWLDPDPAKIVIAPNQWFKTDTDTKDLIPESWVKTS